jgi:hypothetical protein
VRSERIEIFARSRAHALIDVISSRRASASSAHALAPKSGSLAPQEKVALSAKIARSLAATGPKDAAVSARVA